MPRSISIRPMDTPTRLVSPFGSWDIDGPAGSSVITKSSSGSSWAWISWVLLWPGHSTCTAVRARPGVFISHTRLHSSGSQRFLETLTFNDSYLSALVNSKSPERCPERESTGWTSGHQFCPEIKMGYFDPDQEKASPNSDSCLVALLSILWENNMERTGRIGTCNRWGLIYRVTLFYDKTKK